MVKFCCNDIFLCMEGNQFGLICDAGASKQFSLFPTSKKLLIELLVSILYKYLGSFAYVSLFWTNIVNQLWAYRMMSRCSYKRVTIGKHPPSFVIRYFFLALYIQPCNLSPHVGMSKRERKGDQYDNAYQVL